MPNKPFAIRDFHIVGSECQALRIDAGSRPVTLIAMSPAQDKSRPALSESTPVL